MDGFAILLSNTQRSSALQLAKRFKTIIESYPFYNAEVQQKGKMTTSIGVATYFDDANNMEGLITSAQKALADAREAGGDAIAAYKP